MWGFRAPAFSIGGTFVGATLATSAVAQMVTQGQFQVSESGAATYSIPSETTSVVLGK